MHRNLERRRVSDDDAVLVDMHPDSDRPDSDSRVHVVQTKQRGAHRLSARRCCRHAECRQMIQIVSHRSGGVISHGPRHRAGAVYISHIESVTSACPVGGAEVAS